MCGLPRSGKSQWIACNKKEEFIVSADRLRYLVYGKKYWQEGESLMWSIRDIVLKSAFEQGINIIIDETNTTKNRRRPIIQLAKQHRYNIECVFVDTKSEVCKTRVRLEDTYFLNDVDNPDNWDHELLNTIERMEKQFEVPDISEGFNSINIIKP